jgi:hypothetical protein
MTTDTLNQRQQSKLVTLLEQVEAADDPEKAVWLSPDERKEVREIREEIQN